MQRLFNPGQALVFLREEGADGMVLVGQTGLVDIEEGFRMDGKVYPSLSSVAKRITGTTWSGPRFFGLKNRAGQ